MSDGLRTHDLWMMIATMCKTGSHALQLAWASSLFASHLASKTGGVCPTFRPLGRA